MLDVSIIIVNFNTRQLLKECLDSIRPIQIPIETIVVDNASTDGSAEMVEREYPEIRLVKNLTNERFAKPNNDAMRLAKARYVLLLNSDAALKPMALERLVEYMDAHPGVGMCGPQLLFHDGSIQPSCRGDVSLWTHFCDMAALDKLFPRSKVFAGSEMTFFDHMSEREVDHVMAAAVIVHSDVVRQVGMFDERFSIYYNDLDWTRRIKDAGWKIMFYPGAQVNHHLGKTARPLVRSAALFGEQYDNILLYYEKHFGSGTVVLYRVLLLAGFLPRVLYWTLRRIGSDSDEVRARLEFALRSIGVAIRLFHRLPT